MKLSVNGRTLIAHPSELGGCSATSHVAVNHQGVCSVVNKYTEEVLAILPNGREAEHVAGFLSTPDGGQVSTKVISSPNMTSTHQTFAEWLKA